MIDKYVEHALEHFSERYKATKSDYDKMIIDKTFISYIQFDNQYDKSLMGEIYSTYTNLKIDKGEKDEDKLHYY